MQAASSGFKALLALLLEQPFEGPGSACFNGSVDTAVGVRFHPATGIREASSRIRQLSSWRSRKTLIISERVEVNANVATYRQQLKCRATPGRI
jgi:hypothetical protein